jgi:hypothetical protein
MLYRDFGDLFLSTSLFDLAGARQVGAILNVRINADGSWAGGKLVPTYLKGRGIPALDPERRALGIVRSLSVEDFGARAVKTARGKLFPPIGGSA